METVYAFGITIVQFIQKQYADYENLFMRINKLADPNYSNAIIFPTISIFDSVFAAEFILVSSIGNWLNNILKWVLQEHRPYWWVRETQYYGPFRDNKPYLKLGPQTCETGPGSPSGHVMNMSSELVLFYFWVTIIVSQRYSSNRYSNLIKYISFVIISICFLLTSFSRMFIAAHFPHQCVLGLICGILVTYLISNYWIKPFMGLNKKNVGNDYKKMVKKNMIINILIVVCMLALSFSIYWGQKLIGIDPSWSVKLAFKWCPSPDYLHYNTTPFYSLVEALGSSLGWAICVTPGIENFRHNSKNRSFLVATVATFIMQQIFTQWADSVSRDGPVYFYSLNFFLFALRPVFFLRLIPLLSTIGQSSKTEIMKSQKDLNVLFNVETNENESEEKLKQN